MKAAYRQLAVAHHLQCALLGLPQPLKVQILGALWAPPRNLPVPHACARPSSLLPPPLTRRGVRLPASPVAQGTAGCCTAVGTASGCGAASAPAAAAALPLIQPIALQQALRPTAAGGRAQCRGSCCWPGSQAHALKAGRGGRGGGERRGADMVRGSVEPQQASKQASNTSVVAPSQQPVQRPGYCIHTAAVCCWLLCSCRLPRACAVVPVVARRPGGRL